MSGPGRRPETTIFTTMSALAQRHGAVNLGQGFPDESGPSHIIEAAARAMRDGHNQYPPLAGIPELRRAIAAHQRHWYDLAPDPDEGVTVTAGATEALTAAILAFVDPGDEVIALEPSYDSYKAAVAMAGGTLVPVRLDAPEGAQGHWRLDPARLAAAVSDRTRLLLVNSPHNPTGTVLDREELGAIAALAVERDLIAVTDEVYEHLVFDGREHVPLATLPGMWDRTVTIGSAGKTFSVTGWKIGWATGPAELVARVKDVKQWLSFASGTPFQYGITEALASGDGFYREYAAGYQERRDVMVAGLAAIGFDVHEPEGTYFVTAGIAPFGHEDGLRFCLELPERCGVVAVPTQVFYLDQAPRAEVRFAFCKRLDVIEEGLKRLRAGL
ncbi:MULTISPECIES: aminotransferase class I/II-fold pyridoxal phosphate-dependent enzyme [Glycomyces]|uniref:Aminotransferase class I/II-fold pyridoxal phosphate-dependent enzyme n=2 Tax=Glycomyces TaxID=58113 RepID=A0A9X3PQL8_9ACTN|nr:aminotransferase class I/II-fold pyridoxal phosphate-dependent enzyme [Glycomyces lechevalierae]MDA1383648.1 aminotransferase class I/II-fold pyridoxal phosphate-dependent enzyme [Glycomyces lechevalierae]MDR7341361.1 N-succinyldiaminopimelate aminotransferase [Glycomyces lechevalierae]